MNLDEMSYRELRSLQNNVITVREALEIVKNQSQN